MLTRWGETLDKQQVLQEYPRPQLVRESFYNLNGLWDYAITASDACPGAWDGRDPRPLLAGSVAVRCGEDAPAGAGALVPAAAAAQKTGGHADAAAFRGGGPAGVGVRQRSARGNAHRRLHRLYP